LRDEGQDPNEFQFEVSLGKKPGKPATPTKAAKEQEKLVVETKEEAAPEMPVESANNNDAEDPAANNNNSIDEDELIIKDDLDNDCFEEVDRIGDVNEKEVRDCRTKAVCLSTIELLVNFRRKKKNSRKLLKKQSKISKLMLRSNRAMPTMKIP